MRTVHDGVVINGRAVPRELVGELSSDDGSEFNDSPEVEEEEQQEAGVLPA